MLNATTAGMELNSRHPERSIAESKDLLSFRAAWVLRECDGAVCAGRSAAGALLLSLVRVLRTWSAGRCSAASKESRSFDSALRAPLRMTDLKCVLAKVVVQLASRKVAVCEDAAHARI